jgi:predicted molibdopterin-dependent oxidoreductase YjgC
MMLILQCRSVSQRCVGGQILPREAEQHLKLRPGTNVARINSLAHVIVSEGLVKEDFVRARCEIPSFEKWLCRMTRCARCSRMPGV